MWFPITVSPAVPHSRPADPLLLADTLRVPPARLCVGPPAA